MLKSLVRFLIFLVALGVIGYLAFNPLLSWLSSAAMNYTIERLQSPNLTLSNPSFSKVRFDFPKSVIWEDLSMTARVKPRDESGRVLKADLNAKKLILEARELLNGLFVIKADSLNVSQGYLSKGASSAYESIPEALQEGNAIIQLELHSGGFGGIKMQIREFAAEIKRFSEEARTEIPVQFTAKEIIRIRGRSYAVGLRVEQKGKIYSLVANRDDLDAVGRKILAKNQVLTRADIDIIANNPVRAPQLLRIKSRASNEAADACEKNPKVPEHAYRHVLWSYLLAKEFGPDFAKQVTDAHEAPAEEKERGETNQEIHHRRDLANNEIGRRYASLGYSEQEILSRVMTDPRIVR